MGYSFIVMQKKYGKNPLKWTGIGLGVFAVLILVRSYLIINYVINPNSGTLGVLLILFVFFLAFLFGAYVIHAILKRIMQPNA